MTWLVRDNGNAQKFPILRWKRVWDCQKDYTINSHILQLVNPEGLTNAKGLSSVASLLGTYVCHRWAGMWGKSGSGPNSFPEPVTELEGKQSCNHSQFLALTLLVVEPAWLWIVGAPYCHHFAFSASAKATTFILSLLVYRKGDQTSQCKTGCRSLTPASN